MKADAHCAFDKGFDRKLIEDCQPNWIMVPTMWNLHAFDWVCMKCGDRTYQGYQPTQCSQCNGTELYKNVLWQRRGNKVTYSWRFDKNLQFQYWRKHQKPNLS